MKESILYNISYDLSLEVLDLVKELNKSEYDFIAKQLCRCLTSIPANISESNYSESTSDFIHKLKISSKEGSETKYWLSVIRDKNILEVDTKFFDDLLSIQKIIAKSISTAKRNSQNKH